MKLTGIHLFVILLFVLIVTCGVTSWCQSSSKLVEGACGNMRSKGKASNLRTAGKNKGSMREVLAGMEKELKYDTRMTSELLNDSKSSHSKEHYSNQSHHKRHHSNYLPGVPTPQGSIIPGVPTPKKHAQPSPQSHQTYPKHVSRSQIPAGQEDMYILKSEIVPPVCPACPSSASCPRDKPCPPCPPCARCPEPSFECKKVPNYQAGNTSTYLPKPVLTDFSQFGM